MRVVFRVSLLLGFVVCAAAPLAAQFNTRLNPKTDQAFEEYRKSLEAQLHWRARYANLKKPGEIVVAPVREDGSIDVKDGVIHDWVAATLAPRASAQQVLAVFQNYAEYKNVYAPDVTDSKLLRRDGDLWHVFLRMVKKKGLTAVLNGEFAVQYGELGAGRWNVISRSTRIAEVDDGRELPLGTGRGFLWRLNAYWLIEPRPEGLYLECRSLSLSRDIPMGLGWVITPFISGVPRESLRDTMEATLRALR